LKLLEKNTEELANVGIGKDILNMVQMDQEIKIRID
jgi:hypothetical protein